MLERGHHSRNYVMLQDAWTLLGGNALRRGPCHAGHRVDTQVS